MKLGATEGARSTMGLHRSARPSIGVFIYVAGKTEYYANFISHTTGVVPTGHAHAKEDRSGFVLGSS